MNTKKISIGLLFLILALVIVPGASAYGTYVPSKAPSCGVCHVSAGGGGTLTAAGTYFKANGQLQPAATPTPVPTATPGPTPVPTATTVSTPVATPVSTPELITVPIPVGTSIPTLIVRPNLEEDDHHNGLGLEDEDHRVDREGKHLRDDREEEDHRVDQEDDED